MSQPIEEGIWPCTVLNGTAGETDDGSPNVQINVRIDDGPAKGRNCTYEDQINNRSALYISRSLRAVGWKGASTKTLKADIDAWIKATGGKSTVEIKHVLIKKGKKYDAWVEGGCKGPQPVWDKANSIGRGARPLNPMSADRLKDADDALRAAMIADGGAPPEDDVPHAGEIDGDIPFATIGRVSLGEIAKVLR